MPCLYSSWASGPTGHPHESFLRIRWTHNARKVTETSRTHNKEGKKNGWTTHKPLQCDIPQWAVGLCASGPVFTGPFYADIDDTPFDVFAMDHHNFPAPVNILLLWRCFSVLLQGPVQGSRRKVKQTCILHSWQGVLEIPAFACWAQFYPEKMKNSPFHCKVDKGRRSSKCGLHVKLLEKLKLPSSCLQTPFEEI